METFLSTFSFTFGILAALAAFPLLFIFIMVGIPNLIMGFVTRLSSKEHKAKKWARAVELGDEGQMKFLRKWGWDKT